MRKKKSDLIAVLGSRLHEEDLASEQIVESGEWEHLILPIEPSEQDKAFMEQFQFTQRKIATMFAIPPQLIKQPSCATVSWPIYEVEGDK